MPYYTCKCVHGVYCFHAAVLPWRFIGVNGPLVLTGEEEAKGLQVYCNGVVTCRDAWSAVVRDVHEKYLRWCFPPHKIILEQVMPGRAQPLSLPSSHYTCPPMACRSGWNLLDFFVVVIGWVTLLADTGSALLALRALRVLRPLRSINRVSGMRVIHPSPIPGRSRAGLDTYSGTLCPGISRTFRILHNIP